MVPSMESRFTVGRQNEMRRAKSMLETAEMKLGQLKAARPEFREGLRDDLRKLTAQLDAMLGALHPEDAQKVLGPAGATWHDVLARLHNLDAFELA